MHYLLGNYNQSLSDIEKTLTLEPRHFGALSGIGMIMLKLGQTDKALHAFERVLDISPQNVGASKSVKELETKMGPSIYEAVNTFKCTNSNISTPPIQSDTRKRLKNTGNHYSGRLALYCSFF